jgi:hypothetical protein
MDYVAAVLPVNIATDPSGPDCSYHIQLQSDTQYEGFETFSVVFTTSTAGVQVKRGVAQVSIIDDDGKYFFPFKINLFHCAKPWFEDGLSSEKLNLQCLGFAKKKTNSLRINHCI